MKRINKTMIAFILLLAATCIWHIAQAQGPGFDEDVEDTPIDGGATLVLASAAGYGIKKLADKRKARKK